MTSGIENEAGQKRRTKESDPVIHLLAHVTKWDVFDGGRQRIKRPSAELERPKRGCAALKDLRHAFILTTGLFG